MSRKIIDISIGRNRAVPGNGMITVEFDPSAEPMIDSTGAIVVPFKFKSWARLNERRNLLADALEAAAKRIRSEVG